MFSEREILSVVEMLRNENLDVRTVTLGLNLLDCASDDIGRFTDNIYDRITQLPNAWWPYAMVSVTNTAYRWSTKGISVSPMAVAAAPFKADRC
jgi:uncharacterized protein (UPF0210 family)